MRAGEDAMSREEIDAYIAALEEPKRETLANLRQSIREVVPEAEEGLAYGAPAFRIGGKAVAGFAAFKNHLSYLPHSGSVLARLPDEVGGFTTSKGGAPVPGRPTARQGAREESGRRAPEGARPLG